MSVMEIVKRLHIFFPIKGLKPMAAERATEGRSKSQSSRKDGYGLNLNTGSSLCFEG